MCDQHGKIDFYLGTASTFKPGDKVLISLGYHPTAEEARSLRDRMGSEYPGVSFTFLANAQVYKMEGESEDG